MQTAVARKPEESRSHAAPALAEATPGVSAEAKAGAPAGTPLFLAHDAALLAEEDKAFLEVQARSGKPALDLVLSFPARQPVARETLTIIGFTSRVGADPPRRAFDSAGAAAAYASVAAGGSGAAVLQQGKFFFVALLGGGSSFRREEVWKVEPYLGVTAAIGADGASFPLGVELQPGADKARLYDPNMAGPATADALRAIAGVTIEEDRMRDAEAAKRAAEEGKPAPAARKTEKVALSPAAEEAFILAYFRARGIEVLEQNREMVEKLAKDFSPTSKGDVNTPSSGVSSSARDLIESSRKLGAQYRELLEAEATLEKYLSLVQQRRSFRGSGWTIKVDSKEQVIALWLDDLEKMQKRIANQKSSLLSRMPMLAQMVGTEREAPNDIGLFDQFAYAVGGNLVGFGEHVAMLWSDEVHDPTVYGRNQYDESSFGRDASDEELRKEFAGKLDDVRQALRRARSNMIDGGDGFVLGLSSLRQRVAADLASNPALKRRLDEMLSTHDLVNVVERIGSAAIQIGLLFVPGGQVISAAIGLAEQMHYTSVHLAEWDMSKAAVDPTRALVDQQKASGQLFTDTLLLALQAVFLAGEVLGKAAKGGGKLDDAAEAAAKEADEGTKLAPALERSGEMEIVAERAFKALDTMPATAQARADVLGAIVNERLAAAGIPEIKVVARENLSGPGLFEHETWTMVLSSEHLTKYERLTGGSFGELVGYAYHEARHAEQYFWMARKEVAAGRAPAQIAEKWKQGGIELPEEVAKAAANPKLPPLTAEEATKAGAWQDSIFGSGRAARQELLTEMEAQGDIMASAKKRLDELTAIQAKGGQVDPAEMSRLEASYEAARVEHNRLLPRYQALPEEADAAAVQTAAKKRYDDFLKEESDKAPITVRTPRP